MTVDRSYLPYASARNYQDRKMAKWMGFFLSEHTSALGQASEKIPYDQALSPEDKLMRISQAYSQGLEVEICFVRDQAPVRTHGQIINLTSQNLQLEGKGGCQTIPFSDILTITLWEEVPNDSR